MRQLQTNYGVHWDPHIISGNNNWCCGDSNTLDTNSVTSYKSKWMAHCGTEEIQPIMSSFSEIQINQA